MKKKNVIFFAGLFALVGLAVGSIVNAQEPSQSAWAEAAKDSYDKAENYKQASEFENNSSAIQQNQEREQFHRGVSEAATRGAINADGSKEVASGGGGGGEAGGAP